MFIRFKLPLIDLSLDCKHTHESFNSLEPSNEFEQRYMPTSFTVKKEEVEEAKPKLPPPAG
jgi:hypothetical protein